MKGGNAVKKKQLFEKFITENLDNAYRFAFTYTKNQCDAEDVVNESVLKTISSIESLKNPIYIKQWFYKIISNTAVSLIRSRHGFESAEDAEDKLVAEDDYSELTLMSMINRLDIKYREIIVLRFLEDMQINEIAEVMGINENTVKSRLYRALEKLKADMEE